MSDPQQLASYDVFDYEVLQEDVTPSKDAPVILREDGTPEPPQKRTLLKGIMQKADTLNQNGRVYPMHILARETRNYQKFILENRATGELDHPSESVISLKNVSHIVRELYMDGPVVRGTIEVLHRTPSGAILQGLIDHKVKIGISSRGVGSTKKQGDHQVVQDDFQIICFDCVSEPSTSQAFMIPEGRTVTPGELRQVFNRSDRIDRILNEILASRKP
jgi:hypothetical protein